MVPVAERRKVDVTLSDAVGIAGFVLSLSLVIVELRRRSKRLICRNYSNELLGLGPDGSAYLLLKIALINPSVQDRTVAQVELSTEGTRLLIGNHLRQPDHTLGLTRFSAPGANVGTAVKMDALPSWPMDIPAGRSSSFYVGARLQQLPPTSGTSTKREVQIPLNTIDGDGKTVATAMLKVGAFGSGAAGQAR